MMFTVYDLDLTSTIESSSDVVDNIVIYPNIPAVSSANDPFSDTMLFSGNASYSHLELAFRLTCGPDSYGPDCTFCVPTNDSTGRYSCNNVTGEKECLDGYQGAECHDCVPAETCSERLSLCMSPHSLSVTVQVLREATVKTQGTVYAILGSLETTAVSTRHSHW